MNDEQFIEDIADRVLLHVGPRAVLGEWEYVPEYYQSLGYPALVYDDGFYICLLDDGYDLLIGNQEWVTQCLEDLEWRLAKYKLLEGGLQQWLHL